MWLERVVLLAPIHDGVVCLTATQWSMLIDGWIGRA